MLEPRLAEAKEGKRQVYFLDASHFIYGVYLSTKWSMERLFIKSSPGRSRFNVLGALNAVTNEMVVVDNLTTINAWSIAEIFRKLKDLHPNEKISIFLDNARYQRCYVSQAAANMNGIDLEYLPPYSPNLNLIERAWKFVNAKCLNSKYYDSFKEFCDGIKGCIDGFRNQFNDDIKNLLSWNFQVFYPNKIKS